MAVAVGKLHTPQTPHTIIATLNSNRGRLLLLSLFISIPLINFFSTIIDTIKSSPKSPTTSEAYQKNRPLFQAVKSNNLAQLKILLNDSTTYDVNAEDAEGITPLIEATLLGNYDMVSFLLSRGALAQPSPGFRHTPLRAACLTANPQLITFLLKEGADPNAKSEGGRTPLMGACFLRPKYDKLPERDELSLRVVQLMMEDLRTDPLVKNSFGESALDLCKERGYVKSAEYLEKKIADWEKKEQTVGSVR
ncbi:hypothetical protein HJC23_010526 [Cyclotella cryptica]|uniref:Ankyrin repeat protein n=1 Tax=Cyclotella cryptica TaxID=29204 RepID=A0ABD3QHD4_9STRA|eukprot:CCRYP_007104-RA/>CCRYP_007104-RA protein AED:0.05 eAED:-0.02 QI:0/-1/0/1/-1/1/1/0/249